jgi:hypothetical protein
VALETADGFNQAVFVWRNKGQTAKQAVAARSPDGVPLGVDVTVLGWLNEPMLGAAERAG